MKRLRSRTRVDTLSNQQRAEPIRWGRRIYLTIVAIFIFTLINYAVGDAVVLRAEGLVTSEHEVVAATYSGKVVAVNVKEGQVVFAGDILLRIDSADMLKDIAHLATQNADLAQREAELAVRAATARHLLPLAQKHAKQTTDASALLNSVKAQGLVTQQRAAQAIGSEYETAARVADLESQTGVLGEQLPLVRAAHQGALTALRQLEAFYDHGLVRSTRSGLVGSTVPVSGQVIKYGDVLMQIYGSDTSVLAYLSDSYLFPVKAGQPVEVRAGLNTVVGRIEMALTVADALPPEFQNMFRPRDRSRLVRIRLPADHAFAVSQKISVGGCAFGWCWADCSTKDAIAHLFGSIRSWAYTARTFLGTLLT